jgi:hypothetical protein
MNLQNITLRACEVCGTDISRLCDRCTNWRCLTCCRTHCTGGGATDEGHNRIYTPPLTKKS